MTFNTDFIYSPSQRKYIYQTKQSDKFKTASGTEMNSIQEFCKTQNITALWVSTSLYENPHLSSDKSIGSTLAVELPKSYPDSQIEAYKEYFAADFGVELLEITTKNQTILVDSTGEFDSLTDYQKTQLINFADLSDIDIDTITGKSKAFNQVISDKVSRSSYGVGTSGRIAQYIQQRISQLVTVESPVEEVKSHLTGQNTDQRAETIVETLQGDSTKVLFETGTLQPKTPFKQLVNKFYKEAVDEISINMDEAELCSSVEYIPIPGSEIDSFTVEEN